VAGGSCPHRAAKLAAIHDVPDSREPTAISSQDAARIFTGFADRYTDRCRVLAELRRACTTRQLFYGRYVASAAPSSPLVIDPDGVTRRVGRRSPWPLSRAVE
jgi:hypothetical protein